MSDTHWRTKRDILGTDPRVGHGVTDRSPKPALSPPPTPPSDSPTGSRQDKEVKEGKNNSRNYSDGVKRNSWHCFH